MRFNLFKGVSMLRFDIPPVNANVVRLEAFITFVVCVIALLGFPHLLPVLALMGFIRGFFGHYKCPSHRLFTKILTGMNLAGKKENAGAKMFANKILFIASTAASVLFFMGNDFWKVPAIALMSLVLGLNLLADGLREESLKD